RHNPGPSPSFELQTRNIPALVFTSLPPSNHVVVDPDADVFHRGLMPGPKTISRPFAAITFDAHIRFGARFEGDPAILMVSPTFRFSGVASVRRKMLTEFASMSHVITLPRASFDWTEKWTCGFCQATSRSLPSTSMTLLLSYSEPEW